jgi:hypothetical protein
MGELLMTKVVGVTRSGDPGGLKTLEVHFTEVLTDEQVAEFYDYVRSWHKTPKFIREEVEKMVERWNTSKPSRAARVRELYDEGVPLLDGSGKQVGTMHEARRNK